MQYDFNTLPDRSGTASMKWQKYAGKDILPMWVADMDCLAAPEVLEALRSRTEHGVFGYTVPPAEAVQAVKDYLLRDHNWQIESEWIVWLPGLVPGLNLMARAFGNSGDSIMTFTPVYPPFLTAPANSDRSLLAIPLIRKELPDLGEKWTFDFDAMQQAITPRTRMLFLCQPHNPVGRVFSRPELEALADFCRRHDLVVCSDEIHCDLILDSGVKHVPFGTLAPDLADRTVSFYAPSKTYNLPGLSCAFAVIPSIKLRSAFKRAAQGIVTEINCYGYTGCTAAYNLGGPWLGQLLDHLRGNRDYLYAFAKTHLPSLEMWPMEATYLAWFDARSLKLDNPANFFEQHGVGLSDGAYFGTPGFVRLNFGCPRSVLKEGLERMAKALKSLPVS